MLSFMSLPHYRFMSDDRLSNQHKSLIDGRLHVSRVAISAGRKGLVGCMRAANEPVSQNEVVGHPLTDIPLAVKRPRWDSLRRACVRACDDVLSVARREVG
jgi:hypothetical protein